MIELFVEGSQVDINVGFSTMLTMAIDDIKDFGAKNCTYSKTIILPGTKANNILFGNIFEVSSGTTYNPASQNINYNFNAAIGAKAYIFADNIQIFKGIIRIMEIIVDRDQIEYECCVFGELGGFIAKVGNKKLEDLDFSAYNHVYNDTNIVNSWDNSGSGIYYPLIDYGNYSAGKHDWDIRTFRPALFAKEYIDKIFSNAGFSYNSDIFNTSRFKKIIVPHNRKTLTIQASDLLGLSITSTKVLVNMMSTTTVAFPFDTNSGGLFTANTGKTKFTYTGSPTISLSLSFTMSGEYLSDDHAWTVSLRKNGTIINSTTLAASGLTTTAWSWTVSAESISLSTGDYLEFYIYAPVDAAGYDYFSVISAEATGSTGSPSTAPITYGDTVVMNDTLPKNILQLDFIGSIVKLFNLYIFEDYENENILKIKPFIDFYTDATTVDWSDKIDRSQPMRFKPMSELNSRYFEYCFKDDSDYYNDLYKKRYNESYGSYKYDSEFEFAHESTKIDVIFSGTPIVGYLGEDKVYSTIFKRTGNTIGAGEENIDSNIRLLQSKKITGVSSWTLKDGTTSLGSYTSYGYAGHLDDPDAPTNDLQFGVPKELFFVLVSGALNINQFNVYWATYMAEITDKDSRLLTATIKLRYQDVYQLDFSKLVYVDGVLYRINKIVDFNATKEDTCKIELLKVINRIY